MNNFNSDRLSMCAQAYTVAQVCLDESLRWARERKALGQPLAARRQGV